MTLLSDYTLGERIGRGGMGSVYRAVHGRLGREVALKIGEPLPGQDWRGRFQREIQVLMKISHPGIVKFLDGGEDDGRLWYAMELVAGPTLWSLSRERGGLPQEEALPLLIQLVDALAYLHDQGLMHRDVSSRNILIADGHRAVLCDFGLVRGSDTDLTRTGTTVGTPHYISPESLRGAAVPQSDLWSAGVVTYEMLCGVLPFAGCEVPQMLARILDGPPIDLTRLAGDVDPALIEVIARLLERDLARRWHTAAAVRGALARLAPKDGAGAPAAATPSRPARRASRPERALPIATPRTEPFVRPASRASARPRGLVPVAAGAVALLLCALAWRTVRPPAQPPASPPIRASAFLPSSPPVTPGSLDTAALRLAGAHVEALPDGALFVCRRDGTEPLLVEVGRGAPPEWRLAATVRDRDPLVVCAVGGLAPDTDYALRVRAEGRSGGLPAYRFRTRKSSARRAVEDLLAVLREPDTAANPLFGEMLNSAPPELRLAAPLGALLARPAPLADDQVLAIANYALQAPDRALARRLLPHLSTAQWSLVRVHILHAPLDVDAHERPLRVHILHAALAAQLPEAPALLLAALKRGVTDDLLTGLPAVGVELSPGQLEEALRGRESAPGHVRLLVAADAPARLALADALFRLPAARDPRLAADLGHLVPSGPDGDALLERLSHDGLADAVRRALLAAPRPAACRWLPAANPAPIPALVERLRAGCEDARSPLEEALEHAPAPGDPRAVTLLTSLASEPFLTRALARAHHRDAAAWALAHAGLSGALPVLRAVSDPERDPRGVALWARARLRDPEVAAEVVAALSTPSAPTRLALACWAAGELELPVARERLTALSRDLALPAFVRASARAALDPPAGARTYLLLPCQTDLATGLTIAPLESCAASVEPLSDEPAPPPLAFLGTPLWLEPLGALPVRRLARAAGELVIQRTDEPFVAASPAHAGPPLRIAITR